MITCENCYRSDATEEVRVESGMSLELCEPCLDIIFYDMVKLGAVRFIQWADMNYSNALELAYQLFDEDEVNEYYRGDSKEVEYVTMFTYGILKYPYNIKREGGIDIVENSTLIGHKMFSTGSFPVTLATNLPNDKVYGTLFKVPKNTVLHNYDHVEGYSPSRPAHENMYNREEVDILTPNGEVVQANMYIANPSYFGGWYANHYNIPTGNFDDMPKYVTPSNRNKR